MLKTMPTIADQLDRLGEFFQQIMGEKRSSRAGTVWPVLVRRLTPMGAEDSSPYTYVYPETYFRILMNVHRLSVYAKTKSERVHVLKFLADQLRTNEVDMHLFHFGIYLLYSDAYHRWTADIEAAGKRRADFLKDLPPFELIDNDDFISSVWSSLIERYYPDIGEEVVRVPKTEKVRLLFQPDLFDAYTGVYYSDADWVEPVYGLRIDVRKWLEEKDPMLTEPVKEGFIEGPIILGHEGPSGLRHFVYGKPVHAGSYIEVQYGDGWIPGRYEWNFQKGSPIQIHSHRDDCFYIREGHMVRVRS